MVFVDVELREVVKVVVDSSDVVPVVVVLFDYVAVVVELTDEVPDVVLLITGLMLVEGGHDSVRPGQHSFKLSAARLQSSLHLHGKLLSSGPSDT